MHKGPARKKVAFSIEVIGMFGEGDPHPPLQALPSRIRSLESAARLGDEEYQRRGRSRAHLLSRTTLSSADSRPRASDRDALGGRCATAWPPSRNLWLSSWCSVVAIWSCAGRIFASSLQGRARVEVRGQLQRQVEMPCDLRWSGCAYRGPMVRASGPLRQGVGYGGPSSACRSGGCDDLVAHTLEGGFAPSSMPTWHGGRRVRERVWQYSWIGGSPHGA